MAKDVHNLSWAADIVSLAVVAPEVMRWPRVVAVLLGCLAPPPGAAKLKPGSLLVTIDKITAATCLTLGYEDVTEWPVQFLHVFLDDYCSVKSWADSPHCSRFAANVCCSIGLPFAPLSEDAVQPRFQHALSECQTIIMNVIQSRIMASTQPGSGNVLHFATTDAIVALAACDVLFAIEALSSALVCGNLKLITRLCALPESLPGCSRVFGSPTVNVSSLVAAAIRYCVFGGTSLNASPPYVRGAMTSSQSPLKPLPSPAQLLKSLEDAKLSRRIDVDEFVRALLPLTIPQPGHAAGVPVSPPLDVDAIISCDTTIFRIVAAALDSLGRQCTTWKASEYITSSVSDPSPSSLVSAHVRRQVAGPDVDDDDLMGLGSDFAPVKKRKVAPSTQPAAVHVPPTTSAQSTETANPTTLRGVAFQVQGHDVSSVCAWCNDVCQRVLQYVLQYLGCQYEAVASLLPQHVQNSFRVAFGSVASVIVLGEGEPSATTRPALIDGCLATPKPFRMLLEASTTIIPPTTALQIGLLLVLRKPPSPIGFPEADDVLSVLSAVSATVQAQQGHPGPGLEWGDCHFTALKLVLCWALRHCSACGDVVWYGGCGAMPSICWWFIVTNQWQLPWSFMTLVVKELAKRSRGCVLVDVFPSLPLSSDQLTELKALMSRSDGAGQVLQAPIRRCGKSFFNEAVEVTVENITALSSLNCDVSWVLSTLRSQQDVSSSSLLKLSRMQRNTGFDTRMIDTLRNTFGVEVIVDAINRCKRLPVDILADAVAGYVTKLSSDLRARLGLERARVLCDDAEVCLKWLFEQCSSPVGCKFVQAVVLATVSPVHHALQGLPCHGYDVLSALLSNGKPSVLKSLQQCNLPPRNVTLPPSWLLALAVCPVVVNQRESLSRLVAGLSGQAGRLFSFLAVPSDSPIILDAAVVTMMASVALDAPLSVQALMNSIRAHDDMYLHVMLSNEAVGRCVLTSCRDAALVSTIMSSPLLHPAVRGVCERNDDTERIRLTDAIPPTSVDCFGRSDARDAEWLPIGVGDWIRSFSSKSGEAVEAAIQQCPRVVVTTETDVDLVLAAVVKLKADDLSRLIAGVHNSACLVALITAIAASDRVHIESETFIHIMLSLSARNRIEHMVVARLTRFPVTQLADIIRCVWFILPSLTADKQTVLCDHLVTMYLSNPKGVKAVCDQGAVGPCWGSHSDLFTVLAHAGYRHNHSLSPDTVPSYVSDVVLNSGISEVASCIAQRHPTLSLLCMTTIGRQLSVCIEDCCDTDSSESAIIPAHVVKKFVKSTYRVGLVMHACRLLRLLHAYFSAHRDMINGSVGLLSSMATVLQPLMKLLRFVTAARAVTAASGIVDELAAVVCAMKSNFPLLVKSLITECLRGLGSWKKLAKHYPTEFVARLASKLEVDPPSLPTGLITRWRAEIDAAVRVNAQRLEKHAEKQARLIIVVAGGDTYDMFNWSSVHSTLAEMHAHLCKPYHSVDTRQVLGVLLPLVNMDKTCALPNGTVEKLLSLFLALCALDVRITSKLQRVSEALAITYTSYAIATKESYRQLMDL